MCEACSFVRRFKVFSQFLKEVVFFALRYNGSNTEHSLGLGMVGRGGLWFNFKCTNSNAGTKHAYAGWIRPARTLTSLGKSATIQSDVDTSQQLSSVKTGRKKLWIVVFCTSSNKLHIFPIHLIVYLNLPHSGG